MQKSYCKLVIGSIVLTACGSLENNASIQGYTGLSTLTITQQDKIRHKQSIDIISTTSYKCLQENYEIQKKFYSAHGISAYYGDNSSFSRLSTTEKRNYIKSLGLNPNLLNEMKPTSCVGLTLSCLTKGFAAANQQDIWEKVKTFTKANDQDGTALQHALQQLGWKLYYWNPNVSKNAVWDKSEVGKASRGYHAENWRTVSGSKHKYYYNNVDNWDKMVNFNTTVPVGFKKSPLFVATAHMGYHVFSGGNGTIVEGHSTRAITDSQTVESSLFNPLQTGGGPRGQYYSGLIAIPPGYEF